MNKEVLPMRVLNGKYHKEFQHNIGVRQWLIVAGIFYLAYAVSSLSRFSDAPQVGHIELSRRISGYLKKYPKIGYAINPKPLTIDAYYYKFHMRYDFVISMHTLVRRLMIIFLNLYWMNWKSVYLWILNMGTTRSLVDQSLGCIKWQDKHPQHGHQKSRPWCKPQHLVSSL